MMTAGAAGGPNAHTSLALRVGMNDPDRRIKALLL